MTSIFYRFFKALPIAGLFFLIMGAASVLQAATLTYEDPTCDSFSLQSNGNSFTLVCVKSSGPSCSISGTSTVVSGGGNAALSVACSGMSGSLTYTWERTGGGQGTAQYTEGSAWTNYLPPNSGSSGVPYYYTVEVCSGGDNCITSNTWTVTVQGQGSQAPSNCSIASVTTSPNPLTSMGGTATLTASCSGGGAATYYEWRRNNTLVTGANSSGSTLTNSLGANTGSSNVSYGFTVRGCNGGGCSGDSSTQTVNVPAGGGQGSCAGYTVAQDLASLPATRDIKLSAGQIFIAAFTANGTGSVAVEHYGNGIQKVSVSQSKCDFTNALYLKEGNSINIFTRLPPLVKGQTYYVNITPGNNTLGAQQCVSAQCSFVLNTTQ